MFFLLLCFRMGLGVSHVRKDVRILQACTRIYTRVVLRVRFLSSQVGRELRTKHATCAQFFFACLTIFFKDRNQSGDKQEKEACCNSKKQYFFARW